MEFEARIEALADKLKKHRELLETEEAAKTALVMPFLQALGYDPFNPNEVIPEFTADVGTKRGEKVDFAIKIAGAIVMLVECKSVSQGLGLRHVSQLYRYFSVTDAKFAILTNGSEYKFYSDLDASNRMDERPFFEFDLSDLNKSDLRNLAKFQRSDFNIDTIVETAESLQLEGEVRKVLEREMSEPSPEFVRHVAGQVTDRRLTAGVKAAVARHIPNAFKAILSDRFSKKLSNAMSEEEEPETTSASEIETTPEEYEGYYIVRAIASKLVDAERVVMRDSKSYCAILLDDNNRKPIVRLRFNSLSSMSLGTFDAEKNETLHSIERVSDIAQFQPAIQHRIRTMLEEDS